MSKTRIQASIDAALTFLAKEQMEDGGFTSISSSSLYLSTDKIIRHTTFIPALILSAISSINTEQALTIRGRLATFLLKEKSPHWSYNYWTRDSPEAKQLPYPDDLDDTFCALNALYLHDTSVIDETVLAKMTKLLIATESKPGGPYRTWLIARTAAEQWRDVDVAVNANIACFLSLATQPLPPLTSYLEEMIRMEYFCSPYYPTPFPIFYYLARALRQDPSTALISHINKHKLSSGHWGSPLNTALASSALATLGASIPKEALDSLVSSQNPDGSWPAEAFCVDPAQNGQCFYGGSSTLTTAFVVEALQHSLTKQARKQPSHSQKNKTVPLFLSQAREDLRILPKLQRTYAIEAVSSVLKSKNGSDVALLPEYFHKSLATASPVDPLLLRRLGLANIYGWAGYTLLDDIIDNERDAKLLPTAHLLTRHSLHLFLQSGDEHFNKAIYTIFDEMDDANTWEVHCAHFSISQGNITIAAIPRYGTLDTLAARSAGHTLPVIGVLAAGGIPPEDSRSHMVQSALRYYIAARQLNDDVHDWKDDLKAGRITYVVATLLKDCVIQPGTYPLETLIPLLEKQFWNHTLAKICGRISLCTKRSREQATKSQLLVPSHFLEKELERIDTIVSDTLQSVAKAKRFLEVYRES
jgi:hypothetical protein